MTALSLPKVSRPRRAERRSEERCVVLQSGDAFRLLLEDLDGGESSTDVRRRHRSRVDAGVRAVSQDHRDRGIDRGESTDRRQGFAQGPDADVDRCRIDSEVLGRAAPGRAENAESVGLVGE